MIIQYWQKKSLHFKYQMLYLENYISFIDIICDDDAIYMTVTESLIL